MVVVACITQHLMVGCSVNTVLERMWKVSWPSLRFYYDIHLNGLRKKAKPQPRKLGSGF